jgi:PAS domain S-box-containing protein
MNECFLNFGIDSQTNIHSLTALLGELLEADCTLYNRLDGDMLHAMGQWHAPPDFNTLDIAEGHICYDVIKHNIDRPLIVRDLHKTTYAQSDPNVEKYSLKTYMGQVVKCSGISTGSLCAVFTGDFSPSSDDLKLLSILSSAIGKEEERKIAEELFIESETRYVHVFDHLIDAAFLADAKTGYIVQANRQAERLMGMDRKEIIGLHQTFLHPPAGRKKYREIFEKAVEKGYSKEFEAEVIRKDGTIIPVIIGTSTLISGNTRLILGFFREIKDKLSGTSQKKI